MDIFAIGHSNRSLAEFVSILQHYGIAALVDIRTVPKSRANTWFWGDNLAVELPLSGIEYHRIDYLGGLRRRSRTIPFEVNAFWENKSFHNYADWALTPEFATGFTALLELAATRTAAIMCAEVLWWRCHRRIVADYLLASGIPVTHIFDAAKSEPAKLTAAAVIVESAPTPQIQYPMLRT